MEPGRRVPRKEGAEGNVECGALGIFLHGFMGIARGTDSQDAVNKINQQHKSLAGKRPAIDYIEHNIILGSYFNRLLLTFRAELFLLIWVFFKILLDCWRPECFISVCGSRLQVGLCTAELSRGPSSVFDI